MKEYFLILADAELELVPKEIVHERCVLNNSRARGKAPEKMILDASHHHPAFGKLPTGDRRGRPDITHFFLLLALDSSINAAGRLKVFVHTRNDHVIAVKPETRLPPNYIRFIGLIEQLYEQRVVPTRENALLELREGVPLETLVKALKPDTVLVMDQDGEESPLPGAVASLEGERIVIIIGGFSKGGFRSDINKLGARKISLGPRMVKVWTVASKVLCAIDLAESIPPSEEKSAPEKPAPAKTKVKAKATKAKAPAKPRRAPKKKAE
ncbi:MAG: 16S rRNA methyltransferase [Thermoplasmata archaeon]|nr:16S rRNA methyltransferase [Thermoplasmata archaeon]